MTNFPPITQVAETEYSPLPAGSQLMFRQSQQIEESGIQVSSMALYWEATGPMDEAAMCKAMDILSCRRDYLQISLAVNDGQGVIVKSAPLPVQLKTIDREKLAREITIWKSLPQTSPNSPACALHLLKLGPQQYIIGLSGPHELLDIWTIHQALASLAELYNAILKNDLPELSEVPQFSSFCHWYDRLMATGQLNTSKEFWRKLLEDTQPLFTTSPAPTPRYDNPFETVHSTLPLDPAVCNTFEAKVRAAGATTFEGYFTLFNLALARLTGNNDILTAFVASLRRLPELREINGCLLNRFYIPVRIEKTADFISVLHQVSEILKLAKANFLWPVWKEVDREGKGYPGLFFHYVPTNKEEMPHFDDLAIKPLTLTPSSHWPLPAAFQVVASPQMPILLALGQASFCSSEWLAGLQKLFVEMMAEI